MGSANLSHVIAGREDDRGINSDKGMSDILVRVITYIEVPVALKATNEM